MTTNRIYGIDLGTTYSCIAYIDEDSKPRIVRNSDSQVVTPSVVYFESNHNVVVGQAAKDVVEIYPKQCVSTVKRAMGDPNWEFVFGDKSYRPQDISALILRKVVQDAEMETGHSIKDVVITCPAYFGLNQKEATRQAGTIAGLNVLYVIPEPTAAAIAYGMEQESDQVVLVYDLGGGTFDVTLIEIRQGAITVLSTGGDDKLGGKNWDDEIVAHFAHCFETETGISAAELTNDMETYQELLGAAEKCKQSLTSRVSVKVPIRHAGERVLVELTREQFDQITSAHLERTISLTEELLGRAKQKGYREVDRLLLVGGSTYMPQIMERVKQAFPFDVRLFEPNEAVAKGAAVFGYKCYLEDQIKIQIAGETGQTAESVDLDSVPDAVKAKAQREVAKEHGLALPGLRKLTEAKIRNVSSKSFGIVVVDVGRDEEVVNNLIVVDEPVPQRITRSFGTLENNQTEVDLRLMENQRRTAPEEIVELGECTEEVCTAILPFARPLPKGSPIEITFLLGPDGLLTMEAKDLTTGGEIRVERKTESVMSTEQVEASRRQSLAMNIS